MQFANIRYCYSQRAVAAAFLTNLDTVINWFLRSGSSLPNTMLEAHLLSAVHDPNQYIHSYLCDVYQVSFLGVKRAGVWCWPPTPFSAGSSVGSTIPLSPVPAWHVTGQPLPSPLPCLPSPNWERDMSCWQGPLTVALFKIHFWILSCPVVCSLDISCL